MNLSFRPSKAYSSEAESGNWLKSVLKLVGGPVHRFFLCNGGSIVRPVVLNEIQDWNGFITEVYVTLMYINYIVLVRSKKLKNAIWTATCITLRKIESNLHA